MIKFATPIPTPLVFTNSAIWDSDPAKRRGAAPPTVVSAPASPRVLPNNSIRSSVFSMMDPLSALSLAGTIIQFADFGSKLLSESLQLYKSSRGTLDANEQLELVTADLQSVIAKLRTTSNIAIEEGLSESTPGNGQNDGNDQNEEDPFEKICEEAMQIAEELLNRLKALKVKEGKHRAWESLKAAVRCAWSKDEITTVRHRLSIFKETLQLRLMLSIKHHFDAEAVRCSSHFKSLDTQTQRILVAVLNLGQQMSEEIQTSVTKMLCRFQALNEAEHHRTRQMVAEKRSPQSLLGPHSSIEEITAHIEMLDVNKEEEERLRSSVGRNILEDLPYPAMTSRYESVLEAHPQTFNWVFADSALEQLRWRDFSKWLRYEGGIYWVSGKAGSGKSTLMKHIHDDPRTRKYLRQWSQQANHNGMTVCIATFFFWNSGTSMQKSQSGLLRSLLFQILGQYPNLLPTVFPVRWAKRYSGSLDLAQQIIPESWSLRELEDGFDRLIRQTEFPLKLCLFIDGLDEFDGDMDKLCMLFRDASLSNPERIKMCLSSRPWVQFQTCFEGCASLRLQDLTFSDISMYIRDNFRQNQAFRRLETQDAESTSALMREIVDRADGVFLWVEVVVKQLLRGANNRDSISQLWKRLNSFPRELYPLYETIMSQIEPIYLDWASKAFQIMRASQALSSDPFRKCSNSTRSSSSTTNGDSGTSPLTIAALFLALEEESDIDVIRPMTDGQVDMICEDTQIHLTARCAGLLEVGEAMGDIRQDSQIRYMHRTARDFLEQNDQWTKILSYTTPALFSPHFAMMKSCIISPGKITARFGDTPSRIANDALIYAYHADGHQSTRRLRYKLLRRLTHMQALALYCLHDYVMDTLSLMDPTTRSKTAEALLDHICDASHFKELVIPFVTAKMVRNLLIFCTAHRRILSTRNGVWAGWLGLAGLVPHHSHIPPGALSCFVRARIQIIEVFLEVGTTDPTETISRVPSGFSLCPESFYETVMEALGETCDVFIILETIQKLFRRAIAKWEIEDCEKQLVRKRKRDCDAGMEETMKPVRHSSSIWNGG